MRAILQTVRAGIPTIAALGTVLCARRDLLLEILALRHQLAVLRRSDRRFRLTDRLFWMCLRGLWPRWRDALVLVQPATVARWHREGLRGCWSRRPKRRPGRPCIHAQLRALIGRMATENRLWGAPRIHGELLKLGLVVSERTVSRYLPDRRTLPSQTWRTFLANHFVAAASPSTMMSSNASGGDDVVDGCAVPLPLAPSLWHGAGRINQRVVVDWSPPLPRTSPGSRVAQGVVQHRRRAPPGNDPPQTCAVALSRRARRSVLRRLGLSQRPMDGLYSSALLTAESPSAVLDLCGQSRSSPSR
jgi:hypothetical protein